MKTMFSAETLLNDEDSFRWEIVASLIIVRIIVDESTRANSRAYSVMPQESSQTEG